MKAKLDEALHYVTDVSRYAGLAARSGIRKLPGFGNDYTESRFKRAAEKLVSKIHPRTMQLEVTEVIDETPSSKTFRFVRSDGLLPPFRAGQYVNVFLTIDGVRTSRPYSMSSPPNLKHLDLTVKRVDGGFVSPHLLDKVGIGDVIETSGPAGGFYYEPLIHGRDLVFLAGGSGITPFKSIIDDVVRRELDVAIHLFYGSRTPDDVIFGDALRSVAEQQERVTVDVVISEPVDDYDGLSGFLDAPLIEERLGRLEERRYFICGPELMYRHVEAALAELEIPQFKIKRELYGPPSRVTEEPGWPDDLKGDESFEVEIEGGASFKATASEPLLNSLERHGIVVPVLCRAGECSTCRVRVLDGDVFLPSGAGVRESDRENGYIHSCVAYPITDLKLRL